MSHDSHVNYVLMCSLNRILVLTIKTLLLICPFCVQDWNQLPEDMGEDMDDSGGCAWSSRDLLCEGKHSSLNITTLTQAPALHLQLS